jgi:hypothetical protein
LARAVEAVGGARRDRTDDLLLAKQALSQLSYGPGRKRPNPQAPVKGAVEWLLPPDNGGPG